MKMRNRVEFIPSVVETFKKQALKASIIDETTREFKPILKENERLKKENAKLKKENVELAELLNSKDDKYGTVREQLQILQFLGVLDTLKNTSGLKEKGQFFSVLLNRHPQRARKPFSAINSLTFSANKGEAKNIKHNLINVRSLFELLELKGQVKEVQKAIERLDEYHLKNL